ncbi:hypothetical protein E0K83_06705 [Gramella sp. BOM4]|nr:hypothetical protein [Christiangramia bathymodioli]
MIDFPDFLVKPNESGFITFLMGILFILGVYHLLLYFQQGIKSYLYYSIYLLLVFLSMLTVDTHSFLYDISSSWQYLLDAVDLFVVECSYAVYFFFAFAFLDMHEHSPKWNRGILLATKIFLVFCLFVEILFLISGEQKFESFGYLFFLFYIPILSLIAYYPIFKLSSDLRYYIIFGSLILFTTSMVPVFLYIMGIMNPENSMIGYGIFYCGLILENTVFSLGLGHKQKRILQENERANKEIRRQLAENDTLREEIEIQFKQNLQLLEEKAEKEKLEKLKATYEKEMAELKISALKNQMNPHFIFNSLNAIKLYIIDNDIDNAVFYLNKFSKLIRRILASTRIKQISLSEEIEIVKLYLSIENIRFQNEINYSVEIGEEVNTDTIQIPSLILQPFLENSIWHGLPGRKGEKIIKLKISKENEQFLLICIEDNGIGREAAQKIKKNKLHKRESLGIKITKERLKSFFRNSTNNYKLEFIDLKDETGKPKGTKVLLKIPLE